MSNTSRDEINLHHFIVGRFFSILCCLPWLLIKNKNNASNC